jgi:hypothetical protein
MKMLSTELTVSESLHESHFVARGVGQGLASTEPADQSMLPRPDWLGKPGKKS